MPTSAAAPRAQHLVAEIAGRLGRKPASGAGLAGGGGVVPALRRATTVEPRPDRPTAVNLVKPYNSADRFLNLALPASSPRRLRVLFATSSRQEGASCPKLRVRHWGFSRGCCARRTTLRGRDNLFRLRRNFAAGRLIRDALVESELGDNRRCSGMTSTAPTPAWTPASRPSPPRASWLATGARSLARPVESRAARSTASRRPLGYILPASRTNAEAFARALRREG
jgi:hypothetical protein